MRVEIVLLMTELEQDVERLNTQSQNTNSIVEFNNIMLLVSEKERVIEKLRTILNKHD